MRGSAWGNLTAAEERIRGCHFIRGRGTQRRVVYQKKGEKSGGFLPDIPFAADLDNVLYFDLEDDEFLRDLKLVVPALFPRGDGLKDAVGGELDQPVIPRLQDRGEAFPFRDQAGFSVEAVGFEIVEIHEGDRAQRIGAEVCDGLSHDMIDQIKESPFGTEKELRDRVRLAVGRDRGDRDEFPFFKNVEQLIGEGDHYDLFVWEIIPYRARRMPILD